MDALGHAAAGLDEEDGVDFALHARLFRTEDEEQLFDEGGVVLHVLHDVDLVEEDEGVEHAVGRIVQEPRQDHVFEVLQSVRVVDALPDRLVLKVDDFLELGTMREVVTVVGLVSWEVWIVWSGIMLAISLGLLSIADGSTRTLQHPHHSEDELIRHDPLEDARVVEHDDRLHHVAQSMQILETL